MQTVTRYKNIRSSTRKVRIVVDSISGLEINEALDVLSIIPRRGAKTLEKALNGAVANAVNNSRLDKNSLVIKNIDVNEGQSLKRFRPSTKGRVHPYKKRSTNIRIVLEEKQKPAISKPVNNSNVKRLKEKISTETKPTEDKGGDK